jgi:hypothetical protein
MLEKKYSELYTKITTAFERCVVESDVMKVGFQAYLSRLYYLKNVNP